MQKQSAKNKAGVFRIIIVGCGKVGHTLTEQLAREGHDITIIDTNERVIQDICEVIDVMEIPVATAEIVSVQSKLSYARVIEGDAAQVTVGSRLRRIPAPAPNPAADVPVTTTIKSNGQSGVVVPF